MTMIVAAVPLAALWSTAAMLKTPASTAAILKAPAPGSRAQRSRPPMLGVPGLITWLEATAPQAVVEVPTGGRERAPERSADVVAFDLNSMLHNALRNSRTEDQAIVRVFSMLHATLRSIRVRSTVVLALDGAAPLAKIETQRKRRVQSSRRAKRSRGVSGLCATPGTKFMARLESALTYWCCSELGTRRARHLAFELSGSDVPGEGEVKIIDWVLTRSASSDVHDVIFVGADGDLVLQALTISGINAFVLRESATPKAAGVGVCVSTFRSSLARARGIREPTTIDDLEALACFTFMGNDYLPKVREASFERLWRSLCALRRQRELLGERLLREDRTFNPRMLSALMRVLVRVHRQAAAAIAADIEAGVAPSTARAAHQPLPEP